MAFYTIIGQPDCQLFAHAVYVAQYLSERMPNFKYRKILKSKLEWPDFVNDLNKKNKWFMVKSPIIWKEISGWGGKPYLLGGLSEFWDYCYCYYGFESWIAKKELEKLAHDNLTYFEENVYSMTHRTYNCLVTLMFDIDRLDFITYLIEELLQVSELAKGKGLFIHLYKEEYEVDDSNEFRELKSLEKYYNSLALYGNRPLVEIVRDDVASIRNSDVLIFSENFMRHANEDEEIWVKRCLIRIRDMADLINIYGKRELKVIFCNEGPICFMATCLIECCTVLNPANIVALTADKGLSIIEIVSRLTRVPVEKIGAPPVWGFIGFNQYVDETNIIFKANILKPYKRALTAPSNSTLPLGTILPELRSMSYLLPNQHSIIANEVLKRQKSIEEKLGRKPFQAKLRALKSLLKLWFADDHNTNENVISLGVCSDAHLSVTN
ncbi:hypothetical protein ABEB36_004571 [Hypothenemus hampei]|uniref:Uncharacterized protein n=1 Tax=Hypothenemus hampei TaxID=57062 RepID=A0ABD1F5B7_HYPHA